MTRELQSTHVASGIECPGRRNHTPCLTHVIQLALGEFMSRLSSKGPTKSWEAHQRNQQFGENECKAIGKSRRRWQEGNARINQVSAMRPRFGKILKKVLISIHFERPETDLHIAGNAWCIYYTDSWLSKWVLWLLKSQRTNPNTTYHGCDNTVKSNTGGAWASLPITRIHPQVAQQSKIQWLLASLHNTRWMDHCQVRHAHFKAIVRVDPVDAKKAYGYSASHYGCLQWHVRQYGWRYASLS